ncbi:MAG: bifunctional phosphoglucose/phosphomannose isomerase [Candidatus Bathyarchaeia archaeon]
MIELSILDQPDKIRSIDKSGMLETCEKMPDLCRDAIKRAKKVKIPFGQPENIIVAGMGGSAIGGNLLKDWLYDRASIPVEVCRDYDLPAYADENSMVIAVSYSGETEETLNTFLKAVKRHCPILTITSGGHLQSFSEKLKIPHMLIPSGLAPRAAVAYTSLPLIIVIEKLQIIKEVKDEIEETLKILQKISKENGLEVYLKSNEAKRLASEIKGTIPIVYGFRQYSAIARRLKCQFNENSKVPSKFDVFPELNHNEVVGWEAPKKLTKTFSTIFLRDPDESLEIKHRIEITKQIVAPKVSKVLEIQVQGKLKLAKMFSGMYLGDFASIYLALLGGVDPSPTKTIVHLKQEMKKKLDMTARFEEELAKIR